jgi:tRNA dimethylallyltransferase
VSDINLKRSVLAIVGPTASGKTDLSFQIAASCNQKVDIICADSRQIYRGMDIGTAKPSKEEQSLFPHHCIDICNPDEHFSAGKFAQYARTCIDNSINQYRIPIIVGGSGLYIQALCEGFFSFESKENSLDIRQELQELLLTKGKEFLFQELKKVDPTSAEEYSDMNPRRIMRALEFYKSTGLQFSKEKKEHISVPTFTTTYIGIAFQRDKLYDRINKRSEYMWNNGLIDETSQLLSNGYNPTLNALNTVGYKEAVKVLQGELKHKEGLEAMKQATRRYAKRQLTWFGNQIHVQWIYEENLNEYVENLNIEKLNHQIS